MNWDLQFRETSYERNDRMRKARRQRTAEGKCWQCAVPVAECKCPNMDHSAILSRLQERGRG